MSSANVAASASSMIVDSSASSRGSGADKCNGVSIIKAACKTGNVSETSNGDKLASSFNNKNGNISNTSKGEELTESSCKNKNLNENTILSNNTSSSIVISRPTLKKPILSSTSSGNSITTLSIQFSPKMQTSSVSSPTDKFYSNIAGKFKHDNQAPDLKKLPNFSAEPEKCVQLCHGIKKIKEPMRLFPASPSNTSCPDAQNSISQPSEKGVPAASPEIRFPSSKYLYASVENSTKNHFDAKSSVKNDTKTQFDSKASAKRDAKSQSEAKASTSNDVQIEPSSNASAENSVEAHSGSGVSVENNSADSSDPGTEVRNDLKIKSNPSFDSNTNTRVFPPVTDGTETHFLSSNERKLPNSSTCAQTNAISREKKMICQQSKSVNGTSSSPSVVSVAGVSSSTVPEKSPVSSKCSNMSPVVMLRCEPVFSNNSSSSPVVEVSKPSETRSKKIKLIRSPTNLLASSRPQEKNSSVNVRNLALTPSNSKSSSIKVNPHRNVHPMDEKSGDFSTKTTDKVKPLQVVSKGKTCSNGKMQQSEQVCGETESVKKSFPSSTTHTCTPDLQLPKSCINERTTAISDGTCIKRSPNSCAVLTSVRDDGRDAVRINLDVDSKGVVARDNAGGNMDTSRLSCGLPSGGDGKQEEKSKSGCDTSINEPVPRKNELCTQFESEYSTETYQSKSSKCEETVCNMETEDICQTTLLEKPNDSSQEKSSQSQPTHTKEESIAVPNAHVDASTQKLDVASEPSSHQTKPECPDSQPQLGKSDAAQTVPTTTETNEAPTALAAKSGEKVSCTDMVPASSASVRPEIITSSQESFSSSSVFFTNCPKSSANGCESSVDFPETQTSCPESSTSCPKSSTDCAEFCATLAASYDTPVLSLEETATQPSSPPSCIALAPPSHPTAAPTANALPQVPQLEECITSEGRCTAECEDEEELDYTGQEKQPLLEEEDCSDVPHQPLLGPEEEASCRRRSSLKRKWSDDISDGCVVYARHSLPSPPTTSAAGPEDDKGSEGGPAKKARRGIKFEGVTVFYFPRSQGFSCVPSQGGSTLGMGRRHFLVRNFSMGEHVVEQRRLHKLNRLKRMAEDETWDGAAPCPQAAPKKPDLSVGPQQQSGATNGSAAAVSSDDDTEEDVSELSDPDVDADYCYLRPLAIRQRRTLLRESGVRAIESIEKEECKDIRMSRELCGCQCKLYCFPETCQCIQAGIKCQVDRHNFPCGCSVQGCGNPHGRIEFNPIRVRTHFLHTLMRLEIEKRQSEQRAAFQQQQRSRWEEQRTRWLSCLGTAAAAAPDRSLPPPDEGGVPRAGAGDSEPGTSGGAFTPTASYQPPPSLELVRQGCWLETTTAVMGGFKETPALASFACSSCDFHSLDTFSHPRGSVWGSGGVFGGPPGVQFCPPSEMQGPLHPYTPQQGFYPSPLDGSSAATSTAVPGLAGAVDCGTSVAEGAEVLSSLPQISGAPGEEYPPTDYPVDPTQQSPTCGGPPPPLGALPIQNPSEFILDYPSEFSGTLSSSVTGSSKLGCSLPTYPHAPVGYEAMGAPFTSHGVLEEQNFGSSVSSFHKPKSFSLDFGFLDGYSTSASRCTEDLRAQASLAPRASSQPEEADPNSGCSADTEAALKSACSTRSFFQRERDEDCASNGSLNACVDNPERLAAEPGEGSGAVEQTSWSSASSGLGPQSSTVLSSAPPEDTTPPHGPFTCSPHHGLGGQGSSSASTSGISSVSGSGIPCGQGTSNVSGRDAPSGQDTASASASVSVSCIYDGQGTASVCGSVDDTSSGKSTASISCNDTASISVSVNDTSNENNTSSGTDSAACSTRDATSGSASPNSSDKTKLEFPSDTDKLQDNATEESCSGAMQPEPKDTCSDFVDQSICETVSA